MKSRIGNYNHPAFGLPNLVLVGVEIRTCRKCGEEAVVIPRLDRLHESVAAQIISKRSRLTGEEIRYLRNHLEWTSGELAKHFGVDPATVSRWENNKDPIGPVADRLLRVTVKWKLPTES